nr:MAG TPA: hypothetical protein [Caudoviricetes sp.]
MATLSLPSNPPRAAYLPLASVPSDSIAGFFFVPTKKAKTFIFAL